MKTQSCNALIMAYATIMVLFLVSLPFVLSNPEAAEMDMLKTAEVTSADAAAKRALEGGLLTSSACTDTNGFGGQRKAVWGPFAFAFVAGGLINVRTAWLMPAF